MTHEEQLKMCENYIRSLAYIGENGSPFTESQAIKLQTTIQNQAWAIFIEIFDKTP